MKKKVIIFDLDGVLFNSTKLVSDYFLHQYPTLTKDVLDEMLCGNFHEGLEKLKLNNIPIQETPEEKKIRQENYSIQKLKTPLYGGILELLQELHKAHYILTINTSAFEKNCLPLLENSKIKRFFDFVATAEVSRNKAEKFKIIKEKYDVSNENILFITDTLGDIREADEEGVPTVAVTWGAHSRSYFTRESLANLVAIVDSVPELKSLIGNM